MHHVLASQTPPDQLALVMTLRPRMITKMKSSSSRAGSTAAIKITCSKPFCRLPTKLLYILGYKIYCCPKDFQLARRRKLPIICRPIQSSCSSSLQHLSAWAWLSKFITHFTEPIFICRLLISVPFQLIRKLLEP